MLELRNIQKTYEGQPLLHGISFTVASGRNRLPVGTFRQREVNAAAYYRRSGER